MRHLGRYCYLFILAAALTSCGDLFEFEGYTSDLNKITLDRDSLYLMVGDTYHFTTTFDPDTLRNDAVYWMSDDVNIATFRNDTLIAVSEGTVTITAISIEHQCYATARVFVSYGWYMIEKYYPFDMVVNASVTVDGQPLNEHQQVGAFVDDELRGIGVARTFHDISYTEFRIYSLYKPYDPGKGLYPIYEDDAPSDPEKVVFRVYDRETKNLYESADSLIFDGETHGYPSRLYDIAL